MSLYLVKKVLPPRLLEQIKQIRSEYPGSPHKVGVYSEEYKKVVEVVDEKKCSSISTTLPKDRLTEVCTRLEEEAEAFDFPHRLSVHHLENLKYYKGGVFTPHRDSDLNNDPKGLRRVTAVTYLFKSEDLEGGYLKFHTQIKNGASEIIRPEFEVGDTIFFHSKTIHEVTPILQGEREILISFFNLKDE